MVITEEELSRLIDRRIEERLAATNKRRTCDGWLKLRKEISDYCFEIKDAHDDYIAFSGIQGAIYAPIKYALGLRRIDEMTNDQSISARRIFERIKFEARIQNNKEERLM
ncbi:hypothetical protein [Lactiplantibacillus plantarum]|uniref:hypothetical protein n=1 Tax=Lactiplantibacillus plantarum TaxID=1590 RepID=UPI00097682F2|nr:hypothetical protein [Lactiplantibacillus plantarum]